MALLRLREAAAHLGITADTLRAQIRRERLNATKFGRDWLVDESEVVRYEWTSLGRSGHPARVVAAAERGGRRAQP